MSGDLLTSPLSTGSVIEEKALLASTLTGAASFPTLLGVFQQIFKPLKLYCGNRVCSLLGFASVTVASYGASWAAIRAFRYAQEKDPRINLRSFEERELAVSTVGGILIFKVFGGRFKSVLPSHLLLPGAFATMCIPASLMRAYHPVARKLQELGRRYGCHSCGRRLGTKFVADHQPPSAIVRQSGQEIAQQFFPQCTRCSNLQGPVVAAYLKQSMSGVMSIVTHSSRLRLYHAFLPLPAAVIYLKECVSYANMVGVAEAYKDALTQLGAAAATSLSMKTAEENGGTSTEKAIGATVVKAVRKKDSSSDEAASSLLLSSEFPLVIAWRNIAQFLSSLHSPLAAFHLTLWSFIIVAALGTI